MANELADLNAAFAAVSAAVTSATAEMTALANQVIVLAKAPSGIDPAAVEAVAQSMNILAGNLSTAVAAAVAAVAPAS